MAGGATSATVLVITANISKQLTTYVILWPVLYSILLMYDGINDMHGAACALYRKYCGRKGHTSYTLADFSPIHCTFLSYAAHFSPTLAKFLFSGRISHLRWRISLLYATHFGRFLSYASYISLLR